MIQVKNDDLMLFPNHITPGVKEGILILDEEGFITFTNEMVAQLLGYEPSQLSGCHSKKIAFPQHPLSTSLNASLPRHHQITLCHQNGDAIPVIINVTPLTTQSNQHKLISLMRRSDVEQLNEALSHTQRLAGIGTLTSSVAHELTNPISIITATCSNLLHDVNQNALSNTQLLHYVDMIEQSAWRSVRIMEVLRNYAVNHIPQTAVTDLNLIIADALTLVQHQLLKEYNVIVQTKTDPDLKSIVCDHNRITQVLINLLTNARDAMQPGGGTISIQSWQLPPDDPLIPTINPVDTPPDPISYYAFSVRDTGPGIDPELLPTIFKPFVTTKSGEMGLGLGLFISQGIVSQHNGRITAHNNPDSGATFTVILPRKS